MSTQENLMSAFAGESQANRRYLAFARKAESEGKNDLAHLFRAAADGETVHALRHLQTAGEVKTFKENLEAAIAGETYEFTEMYPKFIRESEAEDNTPATMSFMGANTVEKEHQKLFQEALEKDGNIDPEKYFVCQVCGHLHLKEAPEKCPVCGAPKEKFKEIE